MEKPSEPIGNGPQRLFQGKPGNSTSAVAEADPVQIPVYCNRCGKLVLEATGAVKGFSPGSRAFMQYISKLVRCDKCLVEEQQRRAQEAMEQRQRQLQAIKADPPAFLSQMRSADLVEASQSYLLPRFTRRADCRLVRLVFPSCSPATHSFWIASHSLSVLPPELTTNRSPSATKASKAYP